MDGRDKTEVRSVKVNKFQQNPKYKAFLMTTGVGSGWLDIIWRYLFLSYI